MTNQELIEQYEAKTAPAPKTIYTPHTCNDGAGPHFGRLAPRTCARCLELLQGAPKRDWIRRR